MEPKFLQMLQAGWASGWDTFINMQNGKQLLWHIFTRSSFDLKWNVHSWLWLLEFHPILTKMTVATASESNATDVMSSTIWFLFDRASSIRKSNTDEPTRCNNDLLIYKISSTCLGQYFAHHQERETDICSIWYPVVVGRETVSGSVALGKILPETCWADLIDQ